jgi:hypothetical protein
VQKIIKVTAASWVDVKEIAANKVIQSFRNSSKSSSHINDCPLETKEHKFE